MQFAPALCSVWTLEGVETLAVIAVEIKLRTVGMSDDQRIGKPAWEWRLGDIASLHDVKTMVP